MNTFKRSASIEIDILSETLRVTVRPSPHWALLVFQAGMIVLFAVLSARSWAEMSLVKRILICGIVIGAMAGWVEQLFGFSEVIEFDPKHLRIRRETFVGSG